MLYNTNAAAITTLAITIAQFLLALVLNEIIKTLLDFLQFKLYLKEWEFFPINLIASLYNFITYRSLASIKTWQHTCA